MAMSQLAAGGLDQQSASAGPSGYAQAWSGHGSARAPPARAWIWTSGELESATEPGPAAPCL